MVYGIGIYGSSYLHLIGSKSGFVEEGYMIQKKKTAKILNPSGFLITILKLV